MPNWLVPWIVPAVLVAGVIIAALIGTLGVNGSIVGTTILVAAVAAGLVNLRLRYLKVHPPDPELTHKPFWRF